MEDNRGGVGRITQEKNNEVTQANVVLPKQFVSLLKKGSITPNVRDVENWAAINTAPVLVENFLDGQDGQTLFILGDGFTSVKHGVKIFTNTAADKLLSADLIYVFQRRAGIWYELADVSGGGGGAVTSVFGRVGAVVAVSGDYTLAKVPAVFATKNVNYVIALTDYFIRADASGGAITITLPVAAVASGKVFIIKRINAGANNVTVQANGVEVIDGANTAVLTMQYESITVISNGVSWDIV